jgi:hypothetical protein
MAQYDLLLTQNVAAEGIEFSEKYVKLTHKDILTGTNATGGDPAVLSPASGQTDLNKILALITDGDGGVKLGWVAQEGGHAQNTDTGTSSNTFTVDSDSTTGKIVIDVALGASDVALTLTNETLTGDRTITFPNSTGTVALTSQLPSNPLTFKNTLNCAGNPNYPAAAIGDVYVVGTAGKVGGASGPNVESGDTLYCIDTAAEGDHATVGAKWVIVQKNIDGAVTGPASVGATDNIALFDGTTGKVIKDSNVLLSSLATTANLSDYVPKSLFDANTIIYATTDNTPAALTVNASTFVGRKASGDISAMTVAEVKTLLETMPITWVTAPASKTATGAAGQAAYDTNYLYVCTATNTWKRSPIATNWV